LSIENIFTLYDVYDAILITQQQSYTKGNIMNKLITTTQTNTMSSREIAELTNKRHSDVLKDIRKMLVALEAEATDFSAGYIDSNGDTQPEFNLPKRETLILTSGYSIALRAKVIDRWQELENKQVPMTREEQITHALLLSQDVIKEQSSRITQLVVKTTTLENHKNALLGKMTVENMRKVLVKMIQKSHGTQDRWKLLYDEFKLGYGIDIPTRYKHYSVGMNKRLGAIQVTNKLD
jgi:phage regulator Rha-like protein